MTQTAGNRRLDSGCGKKKILLKLKAIKACRCQCNIQFFEKHLRGDFIEG